MADDETFDLTGTPPHLLGPELARWMRAIDGAFAQAEEGESVWAHVAALTAAMVALGKLPGFDSEMLALRDLQGRLERLTVGQKKSIQAIIDGVKTPGRPPGSYSDHMREARAVALVQFATGHGWTEAAACKLVAGALTKAGVVGRRGKLLRTETVKGWLGKTKTDAAYRGVKQTLAGVSASGLPKGGVRQVVNELVAEWEKLHH